MTAGGEAAYLKDRRASRAGPAIRALAWVTFGGRAPELRDDRPCGRRLGVVYDTGGGTFYLDHAALFTRKLTPAHLRTLQPIPQTPRSWVRLANRLEARRRDLDRMARQARREERPEPAYARGAARAVVRALRAHAWNEGAA